MDSSLPEALPQGLARKGLDRRWLFLILMGAMLIIDQFIKYKVRSTLAPYQYTGTPWPGVLELTLTYNEGIAFGWLRGLGGIFTPIAIGIAGWAVWYVWKHPKESPWVHAAMALLGSGAIGNLIDRVFIGHVTDMFAIRFFSFPVFNWADSCITVGAAILVLVWPGEAARQKKRAAEENLAA